MKDLLKMAELTKAEQPKNRVFYRCEKPERPLFGLTQDNVIVTGLTLVPYYAVEFDFVQNEIQEVGVDAYVIMPDDLDHGAVYEAFVTVSSHDWETGAPESWDVNFRLITDADELAWVEAMREEERMYQEAYEESSHNKVMIT